MPSLLHRLKISEVSSVPRGAGDGVKILMMKIDRDAKDVIDLPNFLGKSEDTAGSVFSTAVRFGADVIKVAAAQGAMNKSIDEIEKNVDEAGQAAAVAKSLSQCVEHLAKLVTREKIDDFKAAVAAFTVSKGETPMTEAEKTEFDALKKSNGELMSTVSKLSLDVAIGKMSKVHQDYVEWLKTAEAATAIGETTEKMQAFVEKFCKADVAGRDKVIKEFPPKKPAAAADDAGDDDKMGKMIAKAIEDSPIVKALVLENNALKNVGKLADFQKQAVDLGLPESHGEVMMKAFSGDPEAIKKHGEFLKGLVNQAKTGEIFKEFGGDGGPTGATAYDKIKALGEELRKLDPSLSPQQARAKVLMNPANAALVQQNKSEENARRRAA